MHVGIDVDLGGQRPAHLSRHEAEQRDVARRDVAEHARTASIRRDLVAHRRRRPGRERERSGDPSGARVRERIVVDHAPQRAAAAIFEPQGDRVRATDREDRRGLAIQMDDSAADEQDVEERKEHERAVERPQRLSEFDSIRRDERYEGCSPRERRKPARRNEAHALFQAAARGTGWLRTMSSMRSSAVMPCSCASGCSITRCRNTGFTIGFTSSGVTNERPSLAAMT